MNLTCFLLPFLCPSTPIEQPWQLTAAIAIKQHHHVWTGVLYWTYKSPKQFEVRFINTLGGKSFIVQQIDHQLTYQDGTQTIVSTTPNQRIKLETGIDLPVHSLSYWLRGQPAPGQHADSRYDNQHHLVSLTQNEYQMTYTYAHSKTPILIRATHQNIEFRIRIRTFRTIKDEQEFESVLPHHHHNSVYDN